MSEFLLVNAAVTPNAHVSITCRYHTCSTVEYICALSDTEAHFSLNTPLHREEYALEYIPENITRMSRLLRFGLLRYYRVIPML